MTTPTKYISKLQGTTVLILGGSSGIGFGLAEACIEHQVARLIIASSKQEKIANAISRLQASYPDATTKIEGHECILGDEQTFEANIENLFAQIDGKIDHAVFTAGDKLTSTPIEQLDYASLKRTGMVRFFAPFFFAKNAAKHLTPGPKSSITLTSGVSGDRPAPGRPALTAFSTGLQGLTRSLALDLRPIRVNVVCPSATDTEFWETILGPGSEAKKASIFEARKGQTATGQIGQVEDVVEAYLYSLKDKNTTGSVIRTESGSLIM